MKYEITVEREVRPEGDRVSVRVNDELVSTYECIPISSDAPFVAFAIHKYLARVARHELINADNERNN